MHRSLFCAPLLVIAACASTHSSMSDNNAAKAQFDTLRTLEGDWIGTAEHGDGTMPVETSFHITGNGTTVQETLFKGHEHEMVSMYHMDGDRLMHTHYCAAGNQPRMVAQPPTQHGEIAFEFLDATNLPSTNTTHMHQMRMVVKDSNHIEEWWEGWEEGKAGPAAHFVLTRKSAKS